MRVDQILDITAAVAVKCLLICTRVYIFQTPGVPGTGYPVVLAVPGQLWYHFGRKYNHHLSFSMNTRRSLCFRPDWYNSDHTNCACRMTYQVYRNTVIQQYLKSSPKYRYNRSHAAYKEEFRRFLFSISDS